MLRRGAGGRRRAAPLVDLVPAALFAVLAGCAAPAPDVGDVGAGLPGAAPGLAPADLAFLDTLQERTFRWFVAYTNPENGLTRDRAPRPSFASVAAVGFALTAWPIGVERGWMSREEARDRVLSTLRFFWTAPQGPAPAGMTGHRGFFYHFLDMETGHRFERVELSTIDSALLLAGMLVCHEYFDGSDAGEAEIRALADSIYRRVDWSWARPRAPLVAMGWTPEEGFHGWDWRGYNEAMLLYVLALGSPTHPVEPAAWEAWTETYRWGTFHGEPHLGFGPLFGHQYSHVWIDFRGIRDAYMRGRGIDYFENSRRALRSQRAYAIANPGGWRGYGAELWGLTASDGPLDTVMVVDGVERRFHTYWARGASFTGLTDDGTLVPTALGGSIPFDPAITVPSLRAMRERFGAHLWGEYGFLDAFNPTLREPVRTQHGHVVPGVGWFDGDYLGIDQGPIVAMIENHRTGLVWRLLRGSPYIVEGLRRAGFTGGWLPPAGGD
ncbi:MAG TPA: glucoamylase family protein [Longimicrobiales bacterium]|nr:glucoamylase family protein [Longimicrobiales bacterium]